MIGRIFGGGPCAFLIEWKYAELCRGEDKYNDVRAGRYDDLFTAEKSPFVNIEPRALYFEPFYQLMRQTLLGWQIAATASYSTQVAHALAKNLNSKLALGLPPRAKARCAIAPSA